MFQLAKWIWINPENHTDEYGHFKTSFRYAKGRAILRISCDGNYNAYVNHQLVAFGQYPDYPHYKIYQDIDITKECSPSTENILEIIVWHYGIDYSSIYYPATPGLIFEVQNESSILTYSDKTVLSKLHEHYISYQNKKITSQLGLGFHYDARDEHHDFHDSFEVDKTVEFFERPIKDLLIGNRVTSTLIQANHTSMIFDLGDQRVGFLDIDIVSQEEQNIVITYGENLVNNNVQRIIGDRDFSVSYYAKKGENLYTNYFLRFGGRYLQIYFDHPIEVHYFGLKAVDYPVTLKNDLQLSGLQKQIYDVSIKTLLNCMHEHYEDCPWREQSLYTQDSRNQMLCGYYAFDDAHYQRSNLVLISKGQRESGLLDICFPCKIEISIPFFSLVYPIAVYEYMIHTQDDSILDEVYSVCSNIIKAFEDRIDEQGLISHFDLPYWNFYEWSEGSDSYNELIGQKGAVDSKDVYSLILNCFFLYVMQFYKKLSKWKKVEYSFNEEKMTRAIHAMFYNEKEGLYRLSNQRDMYSVLGNSMAILAKVPSVTEAKDLIKKMQNGEQLVPVTLSMKCYFYDALLLISQEYKDYIINDIDQTYSYMLSQGATTFWETIKGKEDFDGAGSLCHGWSAMPVYYYHSLLKGQTNR